MAESRRRDQERARTIALAKIAARYGVVCGGTDVAATLVALRARIEAARVDGDAALADALTNEITAAGAAA